MTCQFSFQLLIKCNFHFAFIIMFAILTEAFKINLEQGIVFFSHKKQPLLLEQSTQQHNSCVFSSSVNGFVLYYLPFFAVSFLLVHVNLIALCHFVKNNSREWCEICFSILYSSFCISLQQSNHFYIAFCIQFPALKIHTFTITSLIQLKCILNGSSSKKMNIFCIIVRYNGDRAYKVVTFSFFCML